MEGVMKQWEESEAEAEVEEVGLVRRQAPLHSSTITTTENIDIEATEHTSVFSGLNNAGLESSQTKVDSSDIEKNITSASSDPVISVESTSLNNVIIESERVGVITENVQLVRELYLESLYQKPPTQGFYCPNCKACIQKVLILDTVREGSSVPAQPSSPFDTFRCASCFSFLIPIGSWLFPGLVHEKEVSTVEEVQHSLDQSTERLNGERTKPAPEIKIPAPDQVDTAAYSGNQILQPEQVINGGADKASNEEDRKTRDSLNQSIEIPRDELGQDGSRTKPSQWGVMAAASAIAILKKPKVDISEIPEQQPQLEEVIVDGGSTELPTSTTLAAPTQAEAGAVQEPAGSTKTWEILKSIVYGGLIESIASLSTVTSAASADATTLSILALSLANLIGGLFILVHHIWDLKSEQPRVDTQTNALVDRYYQVLGQRENFFLHVSMAILSFLIFGLVPPLVYGFTFYESNNKDLKLAVVAGASLLCITLLAIAKTYVERPNKYLTYFKTVLYYVSIGAMASIVSYLVGALIRKLLEKLGWFGSENSSVTLLLPKMSIEKSRFGSF